MSLEVQPERNTRRLILLHAIANISVGITYLLWSNTTAESLLSRSFPYWLWPLMFVVAGTLSLVGYVLKSMAIAQFAFAMSGIVMGIFAAANVIAIFMIKNLSLIPSAIFLGYLAVLKIYLSLDLKQRERIVQQIQEATAAGEKALEKASDGTASR